MTQTVRRDSVGRIAVTRTDRRESIGSPVGLEVVERMNMGWVPGGREKESGTRMSLCGGMRPGGIGVERAPAELARARGGEPA